MRALLKQERSINIADDLDSLRQKCCDSNLSPLLALPFEVQIMIFKDCDMRSITSLRNASRSLRLFVDEHCYHDRYVIADWENIREVRSPATYQMTKNIVFNQKNSIAGNLKYQSSALERSVHAARDGIADYEYVKYAQNVVLFTSCTMEAPKIEFWLKGMKSVLPNLRRLVIAVGSRTPRFDVESPLRCRKAEVEWLQSKPSPHDWNGSTRSWLPCLRDVGVTHLASVPRLGGAIGLVLDYQRMKLVCRASNYATQALRRLVKHHDVLRTWSTGKKITRKRTRTTVHERRLLDYETQHEKYYGMMQRISIDIKKTLGTRFSSTYFKFGIQLQGELERVLDCWGPTHVTVHEDGDAMWSYNGYKSSETSLALHPTPLALMDMVLEGSFQARVTTDPAYRMCSVTRKWLLSENHRVILPVNL